MLSILPPANLRAVDSEIPPALDFSIELASTDQIAQIIARLQAMGRQTMNFRTSQTAQAAVIRDKGSDKIIGWQGFDLAGPYPERFSLHLDEEYRKFLLGLTLEAALAGFFLKHEIKNVFIRIDVNSTASLMDWRLKTGTCEPVAAESFDKVWLDKCKNCELNGVKCMEKVFIRVDVEKLVQFGMRRLKLELPLNVPTQVSLKQEIIRKEASEEIHYSIQLVA